MADSYNKKNNSGYEEFESDAENQSFKEKFSKEYIIEIFKRPRNIIIAVAVALFLIILLVKLLSSSPDASKITNESEKLPDQIPPPIILDARPNQAVSQQIAQPLPTIAPPSLPNLDIDLFGKLETINGSRDAEDEINSLDIEKLRAELEAEQEDYSAGNFDDIAKTETELIPTKVRKINPEKPPAPILDFNAAGPTDKTKKNNLSDFIFIDSSLDAEFSTDAPNEGRKIPDLGNVIAQGRMMEAILETAINSGIPGTIRAVVSRNVYAEAGRSILIPKGTRLYGEYSAGGMTTGRVIITWSRILRPDGISLGINSFASDQFGRAGVQGDVDKRYGEIIASALLLSSIPLIATIATQQATGGRRSDTTIINPNGTITTTNDPINKATEDFSSEIKKATEQVVKGMIDTAVVITIAQGTRITVMVNQDLKLPRYKPITSLNTTVTNSSQ